MAKTVESGISENGKVQITIGNVKGKLGTRHVQAVLLFLGMVTAFMTRSSMSVAIVAMTDKKPPNPDYPRYDWTEEQTSNILSGFLAGLALMQLPCGYLATTWSAHRLHSCSILLSGILHALVPAIASSGSWVLVFIGRIMTGMCQSSLMACTQTLLSKWSPPFERSRLSMFVFNGALMGNVIGMPVSGMLSTWIFGWPSIFYVFGAVTAAWAILFYCLGADSPAHHATISFEERLYIENSLGKNTKDEKSQKLKVPWRAILSSGPMWCLLVASGGHNWGFYMLVTQLPNYMKNVLKFPIKESGIISALPYLCAWLLAFPYSWLSDYFLKRGSPVSLVRKLANSVAIWGPGFAMLGLCFVGRDKIVAVAIMVVAISLNCGVFCGFQVCHIDLSPNFAGTMMSITNLFGNVLGCLAPFIFGQLVTDTESIAQWNIIFYLTAFLYFFSNAIFVIFGSAKKQPWNEIDFSRSEFSRNPNSNSSMHI